MRDLIEQTRSAYRDTCTLPEVIPERCVHTLSGAASCRSCVDICPRSAWLLDEDQLGIDADRCDGCGLCAAACPQGAVNVSIDPALKQSPDGNIAMIACERSSVKDSTGATPCLHAIGLNQVASLYRQGIETIVACVGDCGKCERGTAPHLSARIADLNRLLTDRNLPQMQYRQATTGEWSGLFSGQDMSLADNAMDRRGFFRRMVHAVIEAQEELDPIGEQQVGQFVPPGCILPRRSSQQMVPFLPQIDATRCNACNACVRLCPHEAISLAEDPVAYRIDPDRCSGCGLCRDLCDQDAVSLAIWAIAETTEIPLTANRCSDCGAPYFTPGAQPTADKLCRICSRHRHHQLLYQVLD